MAVRIVFIILMLLTTWSCNTHAKSNQLASSASSPNNFNNIKIRIFSTNEKLKCHSLSTVDVNWQEISFH